MSYDDDDSLYQMPEFQGRNILIFSDGTGQAGGLLFDERRSNVYKLFRATRCGPDSTIDPDRQLAFYDPGLGSKLGGEQIKIGLVRKVYNILSSATGLGITRNVIDCYAALIYLWRPGDRIFLFGFSRGAYTARCLGGVLGLCGLPTKLSDGSALRRDPATIRVIASEAVRRVYRHGAGAGIPQNSSDADQQRFAARKARLEQQRKALGEKFRTKYAASTDDGVSNAAPHFIGVWDTVAAVGISPPAWKILKVALGAAAIALSMFISWSIVKQISIAFAVCTVLMMIAFTLCGTLINILLRLKFATGLPNFPWYRTMHLTSLKMEFFDRSLNPRVRYARHALALDERRADFDRVPWVNDGDPSNREIEEGAWFTQYWFAGNHSDIGGSYPENESRLSDISLKWMANQAKKAGMLVNSNFLLLFGKADGPQHDECRVGITIAGLNFKWREKDRKVVANATVHPSVWDRFEGAPVLIYDEMKLYRPVTLQTHEKYKQAHIGDDAKASLS